MSVNSYVLTGMTLLLLFHFFSVAVDNLQLFIVLMTKFAIKINKGESVEIFENSTHICRTSYCELLCTYFHT